MCHLAAYISIKLMNLVVLSCRPCFVSMVLPQVYMSPRYFITGYFKMNYSYHSLLWILLHKKPQTFYLQCHFLYLHEIRLSQLCGLILECTNLNDVFWTGLHHLYNCSCPSSSRVHYGVSCSSLWRGISFCTRGVTSSQNCFGLLTENFIRFVNSCTLMLLTSSLNNAWFPFLQNFQDWWTCTSYATFYRKWNLLVHEWIKAYIYQDFKDVRNHSTKICKFVLKFSQDFIYIAFEPLHNSTIVFVLLVCNYLSVHFFCNAITIFVSLVPVLQEPHIQQTCITANFCHISYHSWVPVVGSIPVCVTSTASPVWLIWRSATLYATLVHLSSSSSKCQMLFSVCITFNSALST